MRLLLTHSNRRPAGHDRRRPILLWVILVCSAIGLLFPAARPVQAGGITVTDFVDRQLTDPLGDNGQCSLREAIEAANFDDNTISGLPSVEDCAAGSGADTISFNSSGTINLIDQLQIDTPITLNGPITINGANTGGDAPFRVVSSGIFTLNSVTIKNSLSGGGGAILNEGGTVNIFTSTFENNTAQLSGGGAIHSTGNLTILNSNFVGNNATDANAGFGGAIYQSGPGTMKITATTFSGNTAGKNGGAVYTNGKTNTVEDSLFNGNSANGTGDPDNDGQFDTDAGGGAIFNNSETLNISKTTFSGNLSPNGSGGALFLKGVSTIVESVFNGNVAGDANSNGRGGAIYNDRSLSVAQNLFINKTTFNGNLSLSQGSGGGLTNNKGGVEISNSTFFGNIAGNSGGAVANIDSSSISTEATLILINSTLSNNAAPVSGTPGVFNQTNEIIKLQNTIIANDFGLANCAGDVAHIQDLGHNLQFPGSSCGGSIASGDPQLNPPLFNGGALPSLLTQKPKPGSAAIDQGDNDVCDDAPVNGEDQRRIARPKDGDGNSSAACDIGAVEGDTVAAGYGSTPVAPGPIAFGNTIIGVALTTNFTIFETGNGTLQVSNPALSGPNAGEFAVNTGFPITIPDGGASVPVQLTCTPAAVGLRTATLSLQTNDPARPNVSYSLTCNGTPEPVPGFGSTPPAPGPTDFGEGLIGNTLNATLSIIETGTAPLTVSNPILGGLNPGDFTVTTPFPITIPDGGNPQPVQLTCQPAALGLRTAILTLTTNDPTKPAVSFNLTCTGIKPPDPPLAAGNGVSGVNGVQAVVISPDGKHVYVSSLNDDTVRVYSRNATSGALSFVMSYNNIDMGDPLDLAISPDGQYLYVTNSQSSKKSLVILSRNVSSGIVGFSQVFKDGDICGLGCVVDGLDGAQGVAVSPDGKHIYVAGQVDNGVAVFRRNMTTGVHSFAQAIKNGGNVTGLTGARNLTVSPDGAQVYVASAPPGIGAGGTLTVFSRNAATGLLTFVTGYNDGAGGLNELNGAFGVTVSPDGAHVYLAALWDQAITALLRNPGDGKLSLINSYKNGSGGIGGLNGASDVAVSPDGKRLYATGVLDSALVVFNRTPASGVLSFVKTYKDGVDGINNLGGAIQAAVSPNNTHLYVTAGSDNTIALFSLANPIPGLDGLNPASAQVNSDVFTIVINGDDFIQGSQVKWNGVDRPTQFVNNTQLKIDLAPGDLTAAGIFNVTVVNPAPGGGTSSALPFTVTAPDQNPVPSIETLIPQGATAGDPGLTLEIKGANFLASSIVQWNGGDRPTTFISDTRLEAALSAADLAGAGPAGVTVVNPAPGGGASNTAIFEVAAPGQNPAPSITALNPPSVIAAGANSTGFTLQVLGANFVEGAKVFWNGLERTSSFGSDSLLEVDVSALDVAAPGMVSLVVQNPGPGGGDSNTVTFIIGKPGDNPVPYLTGFSTTTNGDGSVTLTVNGGGFVNGSTVRWNGSNRPTTFVSSNQLTAVLSGSDVAGGKGVITVFNAGPGGGLSNELVFRQVLVYMPVLLK